MKKEQVLKIFSDQLLTIATLASVVLGVIIGLIVRAASSSPWSARDIMYINFIGELFLQMIKGLILPLITSSLIAAIGSLNLNLSGKIGVRAISYYMVTTVMAVILGIILVTTIRPGANRTADDLQTSQQNISFVHSTTTDTMLDLVRNMFPPNIVQACLQQYQTVLEMPLNATDSSENFRVFFAKTTICNQ